ncbi:MULTISPECIES: protease HtpX [unclassified Oleiphilus]|uniref:protease HtpX n=1 Tax=unclassified Oleiphilus TaxID=2631174 RepID=UPI000AB4AA14|nr:MULTISPECIES: protease HtpX [unclassified Oleiphilus]
MMRIFLFLATNLSVVLVASFTLSLLGVGSYMTAQGLDYNNLLIFCLIFGMAGSVVSLLMSKFMAKRSMRVQVIEEPQNADQKWLYTTVQELAHKANIGMPEVGVFNSAQANAFATGWNKHNALVAVSTGLLNKMSREEVKAVLGHEIGHVANGDMITLTLIQGVVNAFVMFFARIIGSFVDRAVFKNDNGHGMGFFIATFIAEMILGVLASTIVFWFSRRREYRADIAGAELVNPAAMVSALARLQAEYDKPSEMPSEMIAFGISGELKNSLGGLFMSHPPLDKRIEALRQRYSA